MYCKNCQTEYNDSVMYCPNCGSETIKKENISKSKIGILPKIFIIGSFILSIVSVIIMVGYTLITSLLYEVKEIDAKKFEKTMNKAGCEILKDHNSDIIGSGNYYATDDSCPYKVLFVEFDKKYDQYDFYDYLINDELKNNGNYNSWFEINSLKYHQMVTKGSYYKTAIMTENTILYLQGNRGDEKDLEKIIDELSYSFNIDLTTFAIVCFVVMGIGLINLLLIIISNFKILEKMGRCGWISLIPFYNTYCLTEGAMGNGWWFLLSFIPGGNMVYAVLFSLGLGESFKKSTGFKILLIFFPTIFKPWIAFDDSKYVKTKSII